MLLAENAIAQPSRKRLCGGAISAGSTPAWSLVCGEKRVFFVVDLTFF